MIKFNIAQIFKFKNISIKIYILDKPKFNKDNTYEFIFLSFYLYTSYIYQECKAIDFFKVYFKS